MTTRKKGEKKKRVRNGTPLGGTKDGLEEREKKTGGLLFLGFWEKTGNIKTPPSLCEKRGETGLSPVESLKGGGGGKKKKKGRTLSPKRKGGISLAAGGEGGKGGQHQRENGLAL